MDIKRIIEQKSIKILFQPILSPLEPLQLNIECFLRGVDTDTGEIIMPLCLIEEAKKHDLGLELDQVVVEIAFKRFKPICDAYPRAFLNININTSIFTEEKKSKFIIGFANSIGIPTNHVIIDLGFTDLEPESSKLVLEFIQEHRKAGFCISLDDIGRDYSNLDKVLLFNPDIIKINHCLIEKMENGNYRKNFIRHITDIAHDMAILIVSTCIEDIETLVDCVANGSQLVQGFHLAPLGEYDYDDLVEILHQMDYQRITHMLKATIDEQPRVVIDNILNFLRDLRPLMKDFSLTRVEEYAKYFMKEFPFVESGCILDQDGVQKIPMYVNKENFGNRNPELFGFYGIGSDHSQFEYFERLKSLPFDEWVTEPYRSKLTNQVCATLSFRHRAEEGKSLIVVLNIDYGRLMESEI